MKKLLVVVAHPDDEAFGPGGTLAKYGQNNVEIHLLCATRGEAGDEKNFKDGSPSEEITLKNALGQQREQELIKSAKVFGIRKVEFLDFTDGQLCNNNYHQLAEKISKKIKDFKPQVVLVNERLGISGHLDHIAVSLTTTYAFQNTKEAKKLYYYCIPKKYREKILDNYFIYFPEGYDEETITTRIDFSKYWKNKAKAMMQHKSQMKDVLRLMTRFITQPKIDHFILHKYRDIKPRFPETDLFSGIEE